jgi:selenide, water dikinase
VTHVVLAGAGHAHLHLLQQARRVLPAGARITLVSPDPSPVYSGMIPGYLQGRYETTDISFDLPGLANAAGVTFVQGWVRRVTAATGTLEVECNGEERPEGGRLSLSFDRLSLDVGSVPRGVDLPGVRENAFFLRPLNRVRELRERVDALAVGGGGGRVAVVGGGAAGVETALAIERRFVRSGVSSSARAGSGRSGITRSGPQARVVLLESGEGVLSDFEGRVRRRAMGILEGRVEVMPNARVARVSGSGVELADGRALDAELVVWATGPAPPPLLAHTDLPLDEEGYFLVDPELRAATGVPVWGAGDCIALKGYPWMPRAGVYAVRQAPVLAANVLGDGSSDGLRRFRPQRSFLSLLNTADGRALLRWKGIVAHTRWAAWLKDRIDRGFMVRHQV